MKLPVKLYFPILFSLFFINGLTEEQDKLINLINKNVKRYEANLNDLIDDIINRLKKTKTTDGFDPIILPNQTKIFDKTILFVHLYGNLTLYNGLLSNIKHIQRTGTAKLTYQAQLLNLRMTITLKDLKVNYDFDAEFLNHGPQGKINATINNSLIDIDLLIDITNLKITLTEINLNVKSINVDLDIDPTFDWLVSSIVHFITYEFKDKIVVAVQTLIQRKIQDFLDNILNF